MNTFKRQLLVATCAFIISGSACAGFDEGGWNFKKDEIFIMNVNQPSPKTGFEYACEKFTPSTVSFTIEYDEPSDMPYKLIVEADSATNVIHDKNNHRYTVNNASRLHVSFPYGGKYIVKNTTGKDVKGSDCDAGIL